MDNTGVSPERKQKRFIIASLIIATVLLSFVIVTLSFLSEKKLKAYINIDIDDITSIVLENDNRNIEVEEKDYDYFVNDLKSTYVKTKLLMGKRTPYVLDTTLIINTNDTVYEINNMNVIVNGKNYDIYFTRDSFNSLVSKYSN